MKFIKNTVFAAMSFFSFCAYAQTSKEVTNYISIKDNWYVIVLALIFSISFFLIARAKQKKNRAIIDARHSKKLDMQDEEFFYRNK